MKTTSSNFQLSDNTTMRDHPPSGLPISSAFPIQEEDELPSSNATPILKQEYERYHQMQDNGEFQSELQVKAFKHTPSVMEDSFALCDYDEFMEEKCS